MKSAPLKSAPLEKIREVIFLFIYAMDFCPQDNLYELSEAIMEQLRVSRSLTRQAQSVALAIAEQRPHLDALIESALTNYRLDRLKTAERTVLRLALFELLHGAPGADPVPPKVVIAEAKRLTKKFATFEAAPLIHSIIALIAYQHKLDLDPSVIQKTPVEISSTLVDIDDEDEKVRNLLQDAEALE